MAYYDSLNAAQIAPSLFATIHRYPLVIAGFAVSVGEFREES